MKGEKKLPAKADIGHNTTYILEMLKDNIGKYLSTITKLAETSHTTSTQQFLTMRTQGILRSTLKTQNPQLAFSMKEKTPHNYNLNDTAQHMEFCPADHNSFMWRRKKIEKKNGPN